MSARLPIPESSQFFVAFRAQLRLAMTLIRSLPNPEIACCVFIHALCSMDHDTGVIRLSKRDLADDLNVTAEAVESALSSLTYLRIFYTSENGWGRFNKLAVNPHIAWKGKPQVGDTRRRSVAPITLGASVVTDSPKVAKLGH